MGLNYRDFEGTEADYRLLAEIDSSASDLPKTIEDLHREDGAWRPEQSHIREFILAGEQCVGADIQYKVGDNHDDTHSFFFTLLPEYIGSGLDEEILAHLIDAGRKRGATSVTTNARDSDAARIQALERGGFGCVTSYVESSVALDRFDASPFTDKIRQVEELGIAVRSAEELDRAGLDWLRLSYELSRPPAAGGGPTDLRPRETFEGFQRRTGDSAAQSLPGRYAALKEGDCVGVTSLRRIESRSDTLLTGFTTVLSAHRRKGIATALKVASLGAAKRAGIRFVRTYNEGNNPMLRLNIQLGFEKVYANLCYRKAFAAK
jgi:GNAT superfamily N-acetyltransferase